MTEAQLISRLKQAGATAIHPWQGRVIARSTLLADLHFERDATAPAGWRWCAVVLKPGHDAVLTPWIPVANGADVDGAVGCWRRDERRHQLRDRRARRAERRRRAHEDMQDAFSFALRSRRGGALAALLGMANEIAGTAAIRDAADRSGLPLDDLVAGLPFRSGPGDEVRQVLIIGGTSRTHSPLLGLPGRDWLADALPHPIVEARDDAAAGGIMQRLRDRLGPAAPPRRQVAVILDDPIDFPPPPMPSPKELAAHAWEQLVPTKPRNRHERRKASKPKGKR